MLNYLEKRPFLGLAAIIGQMPYFNQHSKYRPSFSFAA